MNIVFLNGKFLEEKDAKISPFDHGFLYADGVYETLLVFQKKICFFHQHFSRLQNSLFELQLCLPKEYGAEYVKKIFETLVEKNDIETGRLRFSVSRGENKFSFTSCPHPTIFASIAAQEKPSQEWYKKGVDTCLVEGILRTKPEIKSINFLPGILAKQEATKKNVFEGIFTTSEGFLREGSVSNVFFLSQKEQKIWTAPEKTVLPGTVLEFFFQKMKEKNFSIEEKNFTLMDIPEHFLAFLSNSLFGILPIKKMENRLFMVDAHFSQIFWEELGK